MIRLEELTEAVCKIAKQAGEYIAAERERFLDERVERKPASGSKPCKALTISFSDDLSTYDT